MVAAWMRALTGVGPSIASGSHTWSGNWALLPMAPQNSSRQMPTIIHCSISPAASSSGRSSNTSVKFRVPTVVQMAMMPSAKPDVAHAVDQERLLAGQRRAALAGTRSR